MTADNLGGQRVDDLFEQVAECLPTSDPAHVRAHAYGLLQAVAAEERRRLQAEEQGGGMVGRAKALAQRSFPAQVTLEQAAEACGVSPGVFRRMFLAQTGKSYHQWTQEQRMTAAKELMLQSDMSITQVASEVGYANPSKFARAFRALEGVSPSAWRDAWR